MLLPNNSLGVSDALQFSRCPRLFTHNIRRFSEGEEPIYIAGDLSVPLAYGNAVHEGALAIVKNPDIYLDDALDLAWAEWSHALEPKHHAELKGDLQQILDRTREAENMRLVSAEEDMMVPVYRGEADPELQMGDEEAVWYYYRFRIDALYEVLDEPGHYVIRDFKSYRRKKWQDDIDEDDQFTGYSYGVKKLLGDACKQVTIWVDQCKHEDGEIFSQRTDVEELAFEEFMRSQIRAVLSSPVEVLANRPKLNEFCSWCPLLENCAVLEYASDFGLARIGPRAAEILGEETPDLTDFHEDYLTAKNAIKALSSFKERFEDVLKERLDEGDEGRVEIGTQSYGLSRIESPFYSAKDVAEIVGKKLYMSVAPTLSKNAVEPLVAAGFADELANVRRDGGHYRLSSRMTEAEKKRRDKEKREAAKAAKAAAKVSG